MRGGETPSQRGGRPSPTPPARSAGSRRGRAGRTRKSPARSGAPGRAPRSERQPHVVRDRELEALAHDPDHRGVVVAELHGASEHLRIARESRPPDVVADDRHGRRGGSCVVLDQHPTHERLAVGDTESRDAHLGNVDRTRLAGGNDEVAARIAPCAELGKRPQRLLPLEEVVQELCLWHVRRHVDGANLDEARARGYRKRRQGEETHHLEDDDADADGERHREADDGARPGYLTSIRPPSLRSMGQPASHRNIRASR